MRERETEGLIKYTFRHPSKWYLDPMTLKQIPCPLKYMHQDEHGIVLVQ